MIKKLNGVVNNTFVRMMGALWYDIELTFTKQSSAIIYSITETAKANHLNPFRYLEYILTVMKDHQEDTDYRFMEELLPWSEQLMEICRSKTQTTNV